MGVVGVAAYLSGRELARLLLAVLGRHGTNSTRVGTLVLAWDAERPATTAVIPARGEEL